MDTSARTPVSTVAAIVAIELVCQGCLLVPSLVGLALRVSSIETSLQPETALSWVTGSGAVAALVLGPLFGGWSDRRRHRRLGRAAFIAGGAVAGAAGLCLMLAAHSLAGVVAAWVLVQGGFSAAFAALYGLLAEVVPAADRERVSGWFGAAAVGSAGIGLGLVAVLPKSLPVVLLTMPALALPVVALGVRHLGRLRRPAAPTDPGPRLRTIVEAALATPLFWLIWLQRFLTQLCFVILSSYGVFFLIRRVGMSRADAATWVSASAAGAAVLSVVAAVAGGSRVRRRGAYLPFIATAVTLLAAALVVMSLGTGVAAYVVATALGGVGIGCFYAVDLALALRTVPSHRAGLLLGLFNLARLLPGSLVPAFGPVLLGLGHGDLVGDGPQNYTALYGAGLVVALAALAPLRWIAARRDAGSGRRDPDQSRTGRHETTTAARQ